MYMLCSHYLYRSGKAESGTRKRSERDAKTAKRRNGKRPKRTEEPCRLKKTISL